MNWIVTDKESFQTRQDYLMKLIDEKRKQKEQLEFEITSLCFLHIQMEKENDWK